MFSGPSSYPRMRAHLALIRVRQWTRSIYGGTKILSLAFSFCLLQSTFGILLVYAHSSAGPVTATAVSITVFGFIAALVAMAELRRRNFLWRKSPSRSLRLTRSKYLLAAFLSGELLFGYLLILALVLDIYFYDISTWTGLATATLVSITAFASSAALIGMADDEELEKCRADLEQRLPQARLDWETYPHMRAHLALIRVRQATRFIYNWAHDVPRLLAAFGSSALLFIGLLMLAMVLAIATWAALATASLVSITVFACSAALIGLTDDEELEECRAKLEQRLPQAKVDWENLKKMRHQERAAERQRLMTEKARLREEQSKGKARTAEGSGDTNKARASRPSGRFADLREIAAAWDDARKEGQVASTRP